MLKSPVLEERETENRRTAGAEGISVELQGVLGCGDCRWSACLPLFINIGPPHSRSHFAVSSAVEFSKNRQYAPGSKYASGDCEEGGTHLISTVFPSSEIMNLLDSVISEPPGMQTPFRSSSTPRTASINCPEPHSTHVCLGSQVIGIGTPRSVAEPRRPTAASLGDADLHLSIDRVSAETNDQRFNYT